MLAILFLCCSGRQNQKGIVYKYFSAFYFTHCVINIYCKFTRIMQTKLAYYLYLWRLFSPRQVFGCRSILVLPKKNVSLVIWQSVVWMLLQTAWSFCYTALTKMYWNDTWILIDYGFCNSFCILPAYPLFCIWDIFAVVRDSLCFSLYWLIDVFDKQTGYVHMFKV